MYNAQYTSTVRFISFNYYVIKIIPYKILLINYER